MSMESIDRSVISELVPKALLHDIKANLGFMKQCIEEANKVEEHQVDPDNIDTEMAFGLWAFVHNTVWLEVNIKDERLREDLIQMSTAAFSGLTGLPIDMIDKWFQQMKVGCELVERTGKSGFIALPIMFHLGYGDYASLQTKLTFSFAATLYVSCLESLSGYWSRANKAYNIQ